MRVATSIIQDTLQASMNVAKAAEATGYAGVLTMETNHEPFLPLAAAALHTQRVELATSIALAFPRSPMIVAHTAYDLHVASNGRFVLGLGTQVKGHNERRFSVPWTAPVPRLREYIEALRATWRCWEYDEPLNYQGEHYQFTLMPPNFKPKPAGLPIIPITIAAVGPAMLRLAGRICDGVRLHPFCTRRYLQNVVLPQIDGGLIASGRTRANFEISGGGFIATGPDQASVDKIFEFVRQRVAFYGSTRSYHPVFAEHDLEDLGMKLHQMSKQGQWQQMPAEVPDEVVRLFAAVGTHDEIVAQTVQRFGGVADTISETLVAGAVPSLPPDLIQDIQALEVAFKGFSTENTRSANCG